MSSAPQRRAPREVGPGYPESIVDAAELNEEEWIFVWEDGPIGGWITVDTEHCYHRSEME